MKIYALDNTAACRSLYRYLLGADTYCTAEGLLATIKLDKPDVILLGLFVADMDSWGIINQIRQWYPDMPIVIATALDEPESRWLASKQNCYFWSKVNDSPSALKHIISEIAECLYTP